MTETGKGFHREGASGKFSLFFRAIRRIAPQRYSRHGLIFNVPKSYLTFTPLTTVNCLPQTADKLNGCFSFRVRLLQFPNQPASDDHTVRNFCGVPGLLDRGYPEPDGVGQ